jgi:hypothetical protein
MPFENILEMPRSDTSGAADPRCEPLSRMSIFCSIGAVQNAASVTVEAAFAPR